MGQRGREEAVVRKSRTDRCLKRQELRRNECGNGGADMLAGADSELI